MLRNQFNSEVQLGKKTDNTNKDRHRLYKLKQAQVLLSYADTSCENGSSAIGGQCGSRSACTSVQADVELHCPHMSKDPFLHDTAHICSNPASSPTFMEDIMIEIHLQVNL